MKQQKTGTKPASPMTGLCQRAALWLVWLINLGSPMLNSLLLQVSDNIMCLLILCSLMASDTSFKFFFMALIITLANSLYCTYKETNGVLNEIPKKGTAKTSKL